MLINEFCNRRHGAVQVSAHSLCGLNMSVWASSNRTTDIRHGATAPEPRGEHDVTQNRTYRRRGCGTWRGCIGPHLSVRSRLASWLARRMASRMERTARRRPRSGLWLRRLLCAPHGADAMGPTLASRQPLLLIVRFPASETPAPAGVFAIHTLSTNETGSGFLTPPQLADLTLTVHIAETICRLVT